MVEAVVEHDYDAQELDELSLKKGDIICDIIIKNGGWWEGTLQRLGIRGMFPDNFVKLLGGIDKKSLEPSQSPSSNKAVPGRKCRVLFSYTALVEDELDLGVGDIIEIVGEVEEGWWKGKLKTRVGVFPSNFVTLISDSNDVPTTNDSLKKSKIIEDTPKVTAEDPKDVGSVNMSKSKENLAELNENLPALPPKPSKEMCKVLYTYKALNDDELSLEEGDVITIITKDVQDPGWWKGELKGKIGVFPDNFVKIITPVDEAKPDRPTKVTKSKDAITKSSSSASVYSSSSSIAVSRKFSDSIRPSVLLKPLLPPPPLKKPTLSPVDKQTNRLSSVDSCEPTATKPSIIKQQQEQEKQAAAAAAAAKISSTDIPTSANRGSLLNNVSSSVTKQTSGSQGGNETKWTVIETSSDTADGIAWSRQSYSVTSSSRDVISNSTTTTSSSTVTSSSNSSNIVGAVGENLDLDLVSRSAMLTHPTASRAKVPKRRLPSSLLSREDSRESDSGETLVNGNVEPPPPAQEKQASGKQLPWVEELKLNQAKKSQGGGKTRVLIGSSESSSTTSTSSHTTSSSTNEVSRVALRQVPITAQRPLSLQPGVTHRLSGGDPQPVPADSTVTLSLLQWNQLCDKVTKLENELEAQRKEFGKAILDLVDTIDQQAQKHKKIMSDLERLTDLVTQV